MDRQGDIGMVKNWPAILAHSYAHAAGDESPPSSKLEWLGDGIFDFTTYDGEMSAGFAEKAIEVCEAITNRTTFVYIGCIVQYQWFLIMCNMPFFADKLSWGTSIRGAWWDYSIKFSACALFDGDEQIMADTASFTQDEWCEFIQAIIDFARTP